MQKKDSQSPKKTNHRNKFDDRNTALEELPVGILRTDLKGIIKYVNRQFEEITGHQQKDIINKNIFRIDLFTDDIRDFIQRRMAARISDIPAQKLDVRFKHKDGTWHWVTLEDTLIYQANIPVGFQVAVSDITERKQAEIALKQSEARLKRAELVSKSGNWELHLDSQMIFASEGAKKIYGVEGDCFKFEIIKSTPLPEYRPALDAAIEDLIKNDKPYDIKFKIKSGDTGEIKDIHSTATFDKERGILFGVIQDITERRRAEEQIRYQAGLLRHVSDAIIASDKNGFIQMWNAAAEKIYGWKADELKGKIFHDVLQPEYRYCSREEVMTKLKTEGVWSGEIVHHRKDGQPISMTSTISVLKDAAGNQTGLVSVNHDITTQKLAEEVLKESEEKYRLLVESSRDAIVISQNDKFIFINDAFAQMLGYPKEELLMMDYQNVYTENAVHVLEGRKKQRSRGAAVPDRYETVFRKKDGSEIPVEANIRIIDYHGQKATFAVIRDITKQKEILKTLEEAAKQSRNLEGFIPICAGCSEIRDDEKEGHPWVNPSEYFTSR
ncbi:MAG: hypothetical protein DRP96_06475 [Candidatus Neomarinimicrobiota bacterium]|nr:MAG: hypothetical protein DRP96_06475 [Candidatus Neomarinimicrobiota bacterium]